MNAQLNLEATAIKSHISEKAQSVNLSLTKMELDLEAAETSRVEHSRRMHECLQQTGNLIIGRLDDNTQEVQQHTRDVANQVAAKINTLQEMSTGQSETMVDLLRQIYGCLKPDLSGATSADCKPSTEAQDSTVKREEELSAAIDRLCSLASDTATAYHSDEAENIIEDLEHVLTALMDHDTEKSNKDSTSRKRKRPVEDGLPNMSREIKKLRGMLTASRAIEIDESSAATGHSAQQKTIGMRHSTNVYYLTECTAVVSIKTGTYSKSMLASSTQPESAQNVLSVLQGNISILPRHCIKPKKISASFIQRITSSGFNSLHPKLSFRPIVPYDAHILEAVKTGDTDWMLELLHTGKASLHDCDSEGRSLLNVRVRT